ncbi:MAG TPA: hypothetical protein DD381_06175 [Lentisphaeria bacterium]|nr:MAG: hypothetical protein A2X47_05240 [Lentisphaerae bacterium GWF2_38_69]HBM15913.1 hypothetical protein [Lentisphaeria bacterium]
MNTENLWNVQAIRMGYFPNMKYSQIKKLDPGEKDREVDVPAWTTLLQSNGKNILIDLGICDPIIGSMIFNCKRDKSDYQEEALKLAAGITPEDIDYVIFTHLHWDHMGDTLRAFKKAKFVVQKEQWNFMLNCRDDQEIFYHTSRIICQDKAISPDRWVFVAGKTQLLPGITLIPTPGHSPAHQCVLIDTVKDSKLMVLGDAANTKYIVENKVLSGVVNNKEAYINSLNLIETLADCVIGGHEIDGLVPFQKTNFPKLNKPKNLGQGDLVKFRSNALHYFRNTGNSKLIFTSTSHKSCGNEDLNFQEAAV